jgi:hypothetical protein
MYCWKTIVGSGRLQKREEDEVRVSKFRSSGAFFGSSASAPVFSIRPSLPPHTVTMENEGELTQAANALTINETNAPACWICLDEESDEAGNLPVRNCSCRGEDSGYAHLSCITKYAEQKSRENWDVLLEFTRPWVECPNCKQLYIGQLRIDLCDGYLKFIQRVHQVCDWRLLSAYHLKLGTTYKANDRHKTENTIMKIIQIIEQVNELADINRFEEVMSMTADVYSMIGQFYLDPHAGDVTEQRVEVGLSYLESARDIWDDIGCGGNAMESEGEISDYKKMYAKRFPRLNDGQIETEEEELERERKTYQIYKNKKGEAAALEQGYVLAMTLMKAHHVIEAVRLMRKLFSTCQLTHGREHLITSKYKHALKNMERTPPMKVINQPGSFVGLRYENDKCVVHGPVKIVNGALKFINAKELKVDTNDIKLPSQRIAVVCLGLKNAAYLNGKIGDVRSYNQKENRYVVHFADENITSPKCVKAQNMRILFRIPNEGDAVDLTDTIAKMACGVYE